MGVQWTCGRIGIFNEDRLCPGILGTALTVIPLPEAWLPSDVTIQFPGRQ